MYKHDDLPQLMCVRHDEAAAHLTRRHSNDHGVRGNDSGVHGNEYSVHGNDLGFHGNEHDIHGNHHGVHGNELPTTLDDMIDALDHDISRIAVDRVSTDSHDTYSQLSFQLLD